MKQITCTSRNVVILFNEVLTQELIDLSRLLALRMPSKVELNRSDAFPHMSIYTSNYPNKNLVKIEEKLTYIVKRFCPFLVQFSKKVIDMNTIFINADPNETLQSLHTEIVDSLNPLRDGLYDEKELEFIGDNIYPSSTNLKLPNLTFF